MGHHGVVDQDNAQAFAAVESERFGVRKLHAVERPGKSLRMASQVEFDSSHGFASIGISERTLQIGVGQHAPSVVSQPDARDQVERRRRLRSNHADGGVWSLRGPYQGVSLLSAILPRESDALPCPI